MAIDPTDAPFEQEVQLHSMSQRDIRFKLPTNSAKLTYLKMGFEMAGKSKGVIERAEETLGKLVEAVTEPAKAAAKPKRKKAVKKAAAKKRVSPKKAKKSSKKR